MIENIRQHKKARLVNNIFRNVAKKFLYVFYVIKIVEILKDC